MPKGKIDSFDADEGRGFIQPDEGGESVPFEKKAVTDRSMMYPIQAEEAVTYEVEGGKATQVEFVAPRGYG
jgi:cold shock CspA family protein